MVEAFDGVEFADTDSLGIPIRWGCHAKPASFRGLYLHTTWSLISAQLRLDGRG